MADGSGQTRLTSNAADDAYPAWSPDGARIAFASARDGNQEIYVMNANGTGQTNLSNNTENEFDPACSPAGTRIAFDSGGDVYVMDANGSNRIKLTNNAKAGKLVGDGLHQPSRQVLICSFAPRYRTAAGRADRLSFRGSVVDGKWRKSRWQTQARLTRLGRCIY